MFTKVVLPAPFVPIRPIQDPSATSTLISDAAVTAPNVLFKLLALRMILDTGFIPKFSNQ